MNKKILGISRRSVALTLALALLVGIAFMIPTWAAADTSALGGLIDGFAANDSIFTLTANSRFFLTEEPTGDLLQTIQLSQQQFAADKLPTETPMDIVWSDSAMPSDGDILIKIVTDDNDIGAEGYKLTVTSFATVAAKDVDGLLYGLNMLQKHFRNAGSNTIKGFTAYDTPDTKERVVQLDVARKYFTADWICNFVREMSWMGYNTLSLHFSEDGGFRADLWDPAYYKGSFQPENDFSWICGSKIQYWVKSPYTTDPDAGKYLTAEELVKIIKTCQEYHIDVIPSFDSPAHMDYLTWKFEQNYKTNPTYSFTYNGTTYKASSNNGCINYTNTTNSSAPSWYYAAIDVRENTMARAFVFALYEDIANFFKEYAGSTDFSIGADEVGQGSSVIWKYADFVDYINDLNTLLTGKGYTMRMFNDFIQESSLDSFADNIEIMYWNSSFDPNSGTTDQPEILSVEKMIADNRVFYNCIQTHTYYVLRIAASTTSYPNYDARDPSNHNWTFYHATEDLIYNEWYPADISERGVYSQNATDIPDRLLGGAYFLLWNDYAAVNTEVEMWNGVYDRSGSVNNGKYLYSLRDRMWSNTIKMWNTDINSTLSYNNYKAIRDKLGAFPGLGSGTSACSAATVLPNATDPFRLSDHTALTAELANKIPQGNYSDITYAAYIAAYDAAVAVNNNKRASDEELGAALQNLITARNQLALPTNTFTVNRKTTINGTNYLIDSNTYSLTTSKGKYTIFVPALTGYTYLTTEGSTFTPLISGDGSGYLTGTAISDMIITVWYQNTADTARLDALLNDAVTEQGNYTDSSWSAYTKALNSAKSFSLTAETRQSDVDAVVTALENALTALVTHSDTTTISVEKLTDSYTAGQRVGLYICTTPNIPHLTITNHETGAIITPDSCSGEVQTLKTGEVVKYWLVFFTVQEAGTYTYTVSYNQTSADVTVTVS